MKKSILLVLALSFLMMLAACGTPSDSTPSNNNSDDEPSATVPNSTPSNDTSTSGNGETDDFLKTITDETAEAKGVCGADLTWYYKDNVLVIKGTGEMTDYTVTSWTPTTSSAPWSEGYGTEINWVIIDGGCTSVGAYAFAGMSSLSKVILPDTVTEIDEYVFLECGNLKSITIPAGLTTIELTTFYECTLDEMIFLGDAPEYLLNLLKRVIDVPLREEFTIYYSGLGFEEVQAEYEKSREEERTIWLKGDEEIHWVKQ